MATIRDLANYTGFSVATISRVLNNDPTMKVTDDTRMKILEAADELNYSRTKTRRFSKNHPVHVAIAEMMSQSEKLSDPYYLYLKNYVVRACMEQGFHVSYLSEQQERYYTLEKEPVDGILAIGIFSERQIAQMAEISRSVVFIDSSPDERQFDSVVLNFRLGVEQALEYLMQHGHYRIGFLGPTYKLDQKKRPALEVRRQYFKEYMSNVGRYDERWMIDTLLTLDETRKEVKSWLKLGEQRPTAFLAYNEGTAITAVSVFREAGIRIPEDISIISFNDTPLSILIEPPLTSVNAHLESMGKEAVRLLKDRIEEPQRLAHKVVLPLTLTERRSVWDYRQNSPCVSGPREV